MIYENAETQDVIARSFTGTVFEENTNQNESAQQLAAWLTMLVITAPIAMVFGKSMFAHDRKEPYAILTSDRYTLNGTLIVIASIVAVTRLLVYLYGLFISLLSGETTGNATVDLLHTVVTVTVAGAVLYFGKTQYDKCWKTWETPSQKQDTPKIL